MISDYILRDPMQIRWGLLVVVVTARHDRRDPAVARPPRCIASRSRNRTLAIGAAGRQNRVNRQRRNSTRLNARPLPWLVLIPHRSTRDDLVDAAVTVERGSRSRVDLLVLRSITKSSATSIGCSCRRRPLRSTRTDCGNTPASRRSSRPPTAADYVELNFSPSSEWAVVRFDGYRQRHDGSRRRAARRGSSAGATAIAGARRRRASRRAPVLSRGRTLQLAVVGRASKDGTAAFPTGRWRIRRASPISIIADGFALELPAAERSMKFGIDRLLAEPALRAPLHGKRVALLAHPASVTRDLTHSLDALAACGDVKLTAAFGPQHGLRGDKQDNMVESPDFNDPVHGIPVFSLYGEVRRPTDAMMDTFDVLLVDLQDLGCRIYTFITTLRYVLEAAAKHGKSGVGARPAQSRRPAGRRPAPARRLGELRRRRAAADAPRPDARRARRIGSCARSSSTSTIDVIEMEGWQPDAAPGFGWPLGERTLGQSEPERAEPLDGARLCRHGDARRHDAVRRPRHDAAARAVRRARHRCARSVIAEMRALAPQWLQRLPAARRAGSSRRSTSTSASSATACRSTSKIPSYDHDAFRPWRLQALAFKAIRRLLSRLSAVARLPLRVRDAASSPST